MKIVGVILTLAFSMGLWAKDLKLTTYLKMQEALAQDDFKASLAAHKEICQENLKELGKEYQDCQKRFTSIDDLRSSFKDLSKAFIKRTDKAQMKGLMVAECPMANARWIQKDGPIRNPYYGKSMLECGSKI